MNTIDELARLEAEATPEKWSTCRDECPMTCDVEGPGVSLSEYADKAHRDERAKHGCCPYDADPFTNADAALIVALRNAAAALIEVARAAKALSNYIDLYGGTDCQSSSMEAELRAALAALEGK